jgi:hypothetical protein
MHVLLLTNFFHADYLTLERAIPALCRHLSDFVREGGEDYLSLTGVKPIAR